MCPTAIVQPVITTCATAAIGCRRWSNGNTLPGRPSIRHTGQSVGDAVVWYVRTHTHTAPSHQTFVPWPTKSDTAATGCAVGNFCRGGSRQDIRNARGERATRGAISGSTSRPAAGRRRCPGDLTPARPRQSTSSTQDRKTSALACDGAGLKPDTCAEGQRRGALSRPWCRRRLEIEQRADVTAHHDLPASENIGKAARACTERFRAEPIRGNPVPDVRSFRVPRGKKRNTLVLIVAIIAAL
jgi:hypothetical protein